MTETPNNKSPRRGLGAFTNWFKRGAPSPSASSRERAATPSRIGHYTITGKLGQGGMGIVYVALDERLKRAVALKTMASLSGDEEARKRFWREARAAASVNHPNVCQLYEIGEDHGELFIAMELLEGEPLGARMERGPLSVSETLPIGLGVLAALSALHARGVIHRDLKPSNVFLTPHGVKLLDFGLARTSDSDLAHTMMSDLTRPGMVVGTPRYMSPEQVTGEGLDGRSDLFATGAILFEMLAGRPAFEGRNVVEVVHATLHEQPPALTGSPAVAAVDRVIRRALAKRASERPASAEAMAEELRGVRGAFADDTPVLARALKRLVVLPFRVLRSDPETDFLAFSLPDAIATSLTRFDSVVVRSSATAARFGTDTPDLKVLAVEADVDRVVMGTVLRSGDQLRATAQLVEAPGGTLLTSHTVSASLGDLFRLQDDIARRVVEALSLPLIGVGSTPTPSAPHNPRAYELYLRANELARSYEKFPQALDLYQQSVELDPGFAPAWAQLGRCHRVIGKFFDASGDTTARAEEAYRRALELSPHLSVAHKYYAQLEADTGQGRNALIRLLREANRHGNDPELFAGLVHACRYCGLYEQAIAAHGEARRLDPNVPSSLEQTLLLAGEYERLVSAASLGADVGEDVITAVALGLSGRRDQARRALHKMRDATPVESFRAWANFLLAWLDRRPADMVESVSGLHALAIMSDPEANFEHGWMLCDAGEHEKGLVSLRQAVEKGYFAVPTLEKASQFDAIRKDPRFVELLAVAVAGRDRALAAFREGGGERLLGM